jgi:hypothetical protein
MRQYLDPMQHILDRNHWQFLVQPGYDPEKHNR